MPVMHADPPGFRLADAVVQALVACGVRHFCICPGSRSTPLVLNIWREESAVHSVHHDERSASFQAMGRSLATGEPVAVVTTSGTAVAELLPAAVEASHSQVPLILVTADRPARLRGTGANQTILQPGIFGSFVRAELDVPAALPGDHEWRRQLSDQVSRLMQAAVQPRPGPVHLNVQFDKPFEPANLQPRATAILPTANGQRSRAPVDLPDAARTALIRSRQGVIVVGPNRMGQAMFKAVHALSELTGMPIVADPLSGCRCPTDAPGNVIGHADALLQAGLLDTLQPDLIVRFGSLPVSLRLIAWWTNRLAEGASHIYVNDTGEVHDETNATTTYVAADPVAFCREACKLRYPVEAARDWLLQWMGLNASAERILRTCAAEATCWDLGAVRRLVEGLAPETILFAGNSLPVRLLDRAGIGLRRGAFLGNRGASGIDGLLATALGVAGGTSERVVLLIGDVSLLHDMGSLAEVQRQPADNLCIMVLNNDGGRIFERLPVVRLPGVTESLFVAPHGLEFAGLASAFGLDYRPVSELCDLDATLADGLYGPRAAVLEVRTSAAEDRAQERRYIDLLGQSGAN